MAKVTRTFTIKKREALEIGPIEIRIVGAQPRDVSRFTVRIKVSPSMARRISRLKDKSDLDKSDAAGK